MMTKVAGNSLEVGNSKDKSRTLENNFKTTLDLSITFNATVDKFLFLFCKDLF